MGSAPVRARMRLFKSIQKITHNKSINTTYIKTKKPSIFLNYKNPSPYIQKNQSFSLNMDIIQSNYQDYDLATITGKSEPSKQKKLLNRTSLKSFILNFPLSSLVKYRLIIFILRILGDRTPKKS